MELEIRALTPELLGDYLEFFDHAAFSDHPEWSLCYCMFFHWRKEWDSEPEPEKNNRNRAIEYINAGKLKGYLAYADGKVAGWCNANDRYSFERLASDPEVCEPGETEKKVLSVVCFLIAPAFRGMGIASKLLERACAGAQKAGYDYIEAYPPLCDCDQFTAYHGTRPMFEKLGFVMYKRFDKNCVMRKYFGKQ